MQPIFLIGFMGSGKTTLGRALSRATGLQFVDLDELVEEREAMTVREIFAMRGEDGFRRAERAALEAVADAGDTIIACGGGTPCFFDNVEMMNRCGITVFLDASIPRLHERLIEGRAKRPLIAGMTDTELLDYIQKALQHRMPHYTKATHTFPADRLDTATQIAESVAAFIRRFPKLRRAEDSE